MTTVLDRVAAAMRLTISRTAPAAVACLGLAAAAAAQQAPPAPEVPPELPPPFETLRYNEDYSYLRDPALRTGDPFALEPIKYIPLNEAGDGYLTVGGDFREQYELINNPDFGLSPEDGDGYLLHLYLLHGDLHLGESVRLFGQLRSAFSSYQEVPGPGSEVTVDVQQAFIDFNSSLWGDEAQAATLRIGRQEMAYGAQRMISVRPTIRRTFDGVRVLTRLGDWEVDAWVVQPVEVDPETFAHEGNEGARFWGVYATGPVRQIEGMGIDLYYLGLDQPNATFELGPADDPRHSFGVRLFGEAGAFDYDNEAVYQIGKLGPLDIGAWRLATDAGYSFEAAPLKPRLGLGVDVSSGDDETGDDRFDTFIPLFPQGNPFGASPLIGAINLIAVKPNVQLHLTETVSLETTWSFYWRYSKGDGVYNDGMRLIQPPDGNDERYVGSELTFDLGWQVNRSLGLVAQYSHFFTGAFLNETGPGKDVNYFSVQAQFRF